jgi:hypothetical protein
VLLVVPRSGDSRFAGRQDLRGGLPIALLWPDVDDRRRGVNEYARLVLSSSPRSPPVSEGLSQLRAISRMQGTPCPVMSYQGAPAMALRATERASPAPTACGAWTGSPFFPPSMNSSQSGNQGNASIFYSALQRPRPVLEVQGCAGRRRGFPLLRVRRGGCRKGQESNRNDARSK